MSLQLHDPPSKSDSSPEIREHFIPIRQADLVERLGSLVSDQQRVQFNELSRLLAATFHYEFHLRMEKLKDAYAMFDPDRDTLNIDPVDRPVPARKLTTSDFFAETVELLERANFTRLERVEIEAAIGAASDWGVNLQVDFELFERLEIYARGDNVQAKSRRRLRNRYREERVEVPVYQRLVVVFQLREGSLTGHHADPDRVYLKLFKNIPKMDLEMLLPGTRVKMSRLDQGKIMLPTMSGIALALIKIVKGVALLATATLAGLFSFLGILGGTIGYGVKSFLGYLRTKDKYQLNLTRSLYFQNLDNNAGVLFRLLDEAEEQELREAILGWFLLWRSAPEEGWTAKELDHAAEAFLEEQFSIQVDFEIEDALEKLRRLGLGQRNKQGRWKAVSLGESLELLDKSWDDVFQMRGAA